MKINFNYCLIFLLISIFGCKPDYDSGCGGEPILKYLDEKTNAYGIYNLNDVKNFKNKSGEVFSFSVSNYENGFLAFQISSVCPPPPIQSEFKSTYLLDKLNNLELKYSIYSNKSGCREGLRELLWPNVIMCEFKGTKFFYELPTTILEKDSFNYGDGYYFKKKFINGVEYDSVYECINTYCSFDKNFNQKKKLSFNRKFGILRIQLDSNDYYELTN